MLAPPNSSGTVMPRTPSSPILRQRSMGNWSLRSISAARGAISLWAKSCTALRSASRSSPRPKSRPGSCILVSLELLSVLDAATGHGHQRCAHGGDEFLASAVDRIGPAFGHGDRAARLHD